MGKVNGCRNCYFYSGGSCLWFKPYGKEKKEKTIPAHVLDKGCKYYTTKLVGYLIDKFDGEFL